MAKKRSTSKKSRLKRFGRWSDAHRADVLEEVGLTDEQFRALSRGKRRSTLDRALSLDRQAKDPAFTAGPLSLEQIRANAGNAGQLRYGGAQSQLDQYGRSIDPWFQDYVNRTQALQGQQRQQAQGIIDQSVAQAQQQGQTVLPQAGVDPGSEAAQNDILAAASRKALADAFTKVLQAGQQATEGAYTQQAGLVEASRIGEHRTQQNALADLLKERGAYESDYVTQARDKEHTKGLERKAFGLKQTETILDAQNDRQKLRQERQDKRRERKEEGQKVNQYGYSEEQWRRFSPSHRQRIIAKSKSNGSPSPKSTEPKPLTPAERRARRKEKAENQRRSDFIEATIRNPPVYPKGHPKAGQTPTRAEIVDQLVKKGYSKAEIKAAMRRMYPTPQRKKNTAPGANGQERPN